MNKGFTLVELSIVLVIIGLIVGGVMFGTELVKQSQMNKLMSQAQEYATAVNVFQGKYDELPGDIDKATTFFDNCTAPDSLSTCEGDGDQVIESGTEELLFWRHLSLANLIGENMRGHYDGNNYHHGENAPASAVDGAAYIIYEMSTGGTFTLYNKSFRSPLLFIGSTVRATGNVTPTAVPANAFTPTEALSFDLKFDDGYGDTGIVMGAGGNHAPGVPSTGTQICANSDVAPYAGTTPSQELTYTTSNDNDICVIILNVITTK